MGIKQCVYCGSTKSITKDHIPPGNLFPKPKPTNLITVPACDPCNQSYALDDEYFRLLILVKGYETNTGKKMWEEKAMRSTFQRSPALAAKLSHGAQWIQVRSPAGLHLGKRGLIWFSKDRINRVVMRIVRGLIWHHVTVRPTTGIDWSICYNPPSRAMKDLHDIWKKTTYACIKDSVFRYRYSILENDPEQSVWWLEFYAKTNFVVILKRN